MAKPWDLALMVDAAGYDDTNVQLRRISPDGAHPHLTVRTGPVKIYCLDIAAVTDTAAAWAVARVQVAHKLPFEAPRPRLHPAQTGAVYPIAEIVLEGRQPWNVAPPKGGRRELVVSVGSIGFRIHDQVALDTYVRAWAQASAFAPRVFDRPSPPFSLLLEQAHIAAVRSAARRHDRRANEIDAPRSPQAAPRARRAGPK
jgi:hypothetical protein